MSTLMPEASELCYTKGTLHGICFTFGESNMKRRTFIGLAAGAAVAGIGAAETDAADAKRLHLRFLGTGAADWNGRDARGELRRLSSVLLDGKVLIDFTETSLDMLPPNAHPQTIFYTHSHGDHYRPEAAVRLGVKTAYVHESWFDEAVAEFRVTAEKLKLPGPKVRSLEIGEPAEAEGIRFTALPANHVTSRPKEQTLIYLVEKGDTRLLYATDTGGIMGRAARIAGIDAHVRPGRAITALIMEATMGLGHADDFRIYSHSSVDTVAQTVRVLDMTKRYAPAPGQPVWLTHLARTLHGTQKELDATLPKPLRAACDGLEIVL